MAQPLPSDSGRIIDHLNLELLLYIHVLGYAKGTLWGHCSGEYVDSSITCIPKAFKKKDSF